MINLVMIFWEVGFKTDIHAQINFELTKFGENCKFIENLDDFNAIYKCILTCVQFDLYLIKFNDLLDKL